MAIFASCADAAVTIASIFHLIYNLYADANCSI